MSELHDMLRAASDASARGAAAGEGERAEIRARVGAGRRRRTLGTVAAGLAGVMVAGAATVALASHTGGGTGPAAPDPSATITVETSAETWMFGDSSLEGLPYVMDAVGGGTAEFATWSGEQAWEENGGPLGEPFRGPVLEAVEPSAFEGYGAGWAFIVDDSVDPSTSRSRDSRLLLAAPDGESQEVADLGALAEQLDLGGVFVADVAASSDAPEVLVAIDGSRASAVVSIDLATGVTWVLVDGDRASMMTLSWRGGSTWVAWGVADTMPIAVAFTVNEAGASISWQDAWVPSVKGAEFGGMASSGGLVVAYSVMPGVSLLVDMDNRVLVLDREVGGVLGRLDDCYVVEDLEDRLHCVDSESGEWAPLDHLSAPTRQYTGHAVLDDGYVEGAESERGQTTVIWHQPGGDTEIDVPAGSSVSYMGDGEAVWLTTSVGGALTDAHVGVIGLDGVYREVDLPLADAGMEESALAYPVG